MDVPWPYLENGNHGMAAGDLTDGEAGADGSLPYRSGNCGWQSRTHRAGRNPNFPVEPGAAAGFHAPFFDGKAGIQRSVWCEWQDNPKGM